MTIKSTSGLQNQNSLLSTSKWRDCLIKLPLHVSLQAHAELLPRFCVAESSQSAQDPNADIWLHAHPHKPSEHCLELLNILWQMTFKNRDQQNYFQLIWIVSASAVSVNLQTQQVGYNPRGTFPC